jgi:hypothetical protein
VLFAPHCVPAPAQFPPAPEHCAEVSPEMQNPLLKQHAPVGCGQLTPAHVVPSPWNVPPAAAHSPVEVVMHDPSGRQHAPTPGVQFRLDHVVRLTQSPVGRHSPAVNWLNRAHPPLGGQPKGPQLSPKSQLFAACASPDTSVHGNAFRLGSGALEHGFKGGRLCRSIRNATVNRPEPLLFSTNCSGSFGSIENCRFTPLVPAGISM